VTTRSSTGRQNARFTAHADQGHYYNYLQGHLGSILPNGDDYEEESVFRIANKMLPFRLRAAAVALPIAAAAV